MAKGDFGSTQFFFLTGSLGGFGRAFGISPTEIGKLTWKQFNNLIKHAEVALDNMEIAKMVEESKMVNNTKH